ncbi:hypothetical protein RFI_22419 [Reticulomyxa filosa]|uniref:Uncharacterized protein n=1 Tax=Reticulomyxa filosa TaxID=46433 RepID=X6MLS2_RETFI|nr:hypothetical protein RFI_22419 [Reticulomyxa filosa]|eukprot:ETO14948.1 hypothetical protein RFI_22419 [Reticulomyxa filosa]
MSNSYQSTTAISNSKSSNKTTVIAVVVAAVGFALLAVVVMLVVRWIRERARKVEEATKGIDLPKAMSQKSLDETENDRILTNILDKNKKDPTFTTGVNLQTQKAAVSQIFLDVLKEINQNGETNATMAEIRAVTVKASDPPPVNPIEQPLEQMPQLAEDSSESGGENGADNGGVFKKKRSQKKMEEQQKQGQINKKEDKDESESDLEEDGGEETDSSSSAILAAVTAATVVAVDKVVDVNTSNKPIDSIEQEKGKHNDRENLPQMQDLGRVGSEDTEIEELYEKDSEQNNNDNKHNPNNNHSNNNHNNNSDHKGNGVPVMITVVSMDHLPEENASPVDNGTSSVRISMAVEENAPQQHSQQQDNPPSLQNNFVSVANVYKSRTPGQYPPSSSDNPKNKGNRDRADDDIDGSDDSEEQDEYEEMYKQ